MLSLARLTVFLCWLFSSLSVLAQDDAAITPLRLSHAEGDVSFLRTGAENWVKAQRNTPITTGDALYIGNDSDLELQLGNRAFIRADDDTHLSVVNLEADYLQLKVTAGRVSLDLRALPNNFLIELDTPNAVFNIDHTGYYRLDVDGDTHFITRRGGRASMVPAGGTLLSVNPTEEIVVQGTSPARAETYAAPPLDQWDQWNYERSEELIEAVSERYLSPGIAGAYDLDHYGSWRVVPEYGTVWVPDGLPYGWAPYSTGRWIWDPYFQWTWIDDAPWGWAPFHYGRWVYLSGFWAWAPGPVVGVRAVYAPALVAFFSSGTGLSIGFGISNGNLSWLALSWGEPLIPWWGRPGFVGRPWWGGWGGPRIVNNIVINRTTHIDIERIDYRNRNVPDALIGMRADRFGRSHVHDAPVRGGERALRHLRGALPIKPDAASAAGGIATARQPPRTVVRPVVGTRPAPATQTPWRSERPQQTPMVIVPKPRDEPRAKTGTPTLPRPEFGKQAGEERPRPPLPPRYQERRRQAENVPRKQAEPQRSEVRQEQREQQRDAAPPEPRSVQPAPPRERIQEQVRARIEERRQERVEERQRMELPGKPANQMLRRQQQQEQGERRRSEQRDK